MATNPFSEWTKMFGDFRTPAVDMNQFITQYRRNAETGSTVIQLITESAQAIARRQAEILRSNTEQALKASRDLMSHSSPDAAASKQADFAKNWLDFNVNSARNWLDFNVNSAREIAEMSAKSVQEAFDVLNKRAAEQLKEFSEVATATVHSAKKKAA